MATSKGILLDRPIKVRVSVSITDEGREPWIYGTLANNEIEIGTQMIGHAMGIGAAVDAMLVAMMPQVPELQREAVAKKLAEEAEAKAAEEAQESEG